MKKWPLDLRMQGLSQLLPDEEGTRRFAWPYKQNENPHHREDTMSEGASGAARRSILKLFRFCVV
jgi:hypothetical protein